MSLFPKASRMVLPCEALAPTCTGQLVQSQNAQSNLPRAIFTESGAQSLLRRSTCAKSNFKIFKCKINTQSVRSSSWITAAFKCKSSTLSALAAKSQPFRTKVERNVRSRGKSQLAQRSWNGALAESDAETCTQQLAQSAHVKMLAQSNLH